MDAITQSTTAAPGARTQTTPPAPAAQQEQGSAINSDFETFLKMLTAQLENQDPLNPLESQDFATQLATFSNVEQQTLTNTHLEDISARLGASDLSEMSQWIGKEARISGTLPFTGTPMVIEPKMTPGAVSATLIVEDAAGREVARQPLDPAGTGPLMWTGLGANGAAVSPGAYNFRIENEAVEGALPDGTVSAYVPVREARSGPAGPTLMLEGGLEISPDDVTALRAPIEDI